MKPMENTDLQRQPLEAPVKAYYDFSKLFKAAKTYIDSYNAGKDTLKEKLNAGHRATAELMIRLYAKQLNCYISRNEYLDSIPGFKTYNSSLATCKGCSVRTIINHKERLKAAGFIIREKHCGKTGVELWVNPAIFDMQGVSTPFVNKPFEKPRKTSFLNGKVKIFHPLVHEQQEQINNNSTVDSLKGKKEKGVRLPAHTLMTTHVAGTEHEQDKNTRESYASGPKKQTGRKKTGPVQRPGLGFLLSLVTDFWQYTRATLYPDTIFCQYEHTEILKNIRLSVYRDFKISGNKQEWLDYQKNLYLRVDMVFRWMARNPERWIPPAHLYFHPENKNNGFTKTWQWYIKQQLLKKGIRNRILLQKAAKEWENHEKGAGKHQSRLQMFTAQKKQLETYGDEGLMQAYNQSLQRNLCKPTR